MGSPITPYAAIGVQLWIGDGGSTETFFQMARIQDVAGPKLKRDVIEVTTHDSAAGYKEYIGSLKDGQQVTFPLVLDPNYSGHNETPTVVGVNPGGFKYLFEENVRRNMRIAIPSSPANRIRMIGQVVGFELDLKVHGAEMANITIQVSGEPILEAGTGAGA